MSEERNDVPSTDAVIHLDGAMGEGGGQILRSALALSLVTGRPFRLDNIRAGRKKPGLLRQHLVGVEAAQRIGGAFVAGATLGSRSLSFRPNGLHAGHYRFSIGSAGSTTLVAQAVLPALIMAEGPSTLEVEGGTHNPSAPPFEYLAEWFIPMLRRCGVGLSVSLVRAGFYPAGGGLLRVRTEGGGFRSGSPVSPEPRGEVLRIRARAVVAELPVSIAEREIATVQRKLRLSANQVSIDEVGNGPGNYVVVEVVTDRSTEVFTAFGRPRVSAEDVASQVVRDVKAFLRNEGAAISEHGADQLLLPMALGVERGSEASFTSVRPSSHTETNARVIEAFLPDVRIRFDADPTGYWSVRVAR